MGIGISIVKGVHHGFITILCIVLGSEVEGLVLKLYKSFSLGLTCTVFV